MPPIPQTKQEKVAYVKSQGQTRGHHCHWPGCTKNVPPAMWGCYKHWLMLPLQLRDKVWETFRPGQETDWTPSDAYFEVALEIQQWIKENYPLPICAACGGTGKNSRGNLCAPCVMKSRSVMKGKIK